MESNVQIFKSEEFGEMRTVAINNEMWFVAKDVCSILELTNPTIALQRLDDDERSKFNLGRQGKSNIVNESGLYSLIMGSRKKEAKQFRKWVTSEVLPTIRKTGGYVQENNEEKFINSYFPSLSDETKIVLIKDLQKSVIEMKPKAEQFDLYIDSQGTLSFNQSAKALRTKRNKMMEYLRVKNVLNQDNSPSKYYAEKDYFQVKGYTYVLNNNKKMQRAITRVTATGQDFLYRFLTKNVNEYNIFDNNFCNICKVGVK